MDPRRAKQLIYGSGFIAVFAAILISIIYFSLQNEPDCFDKIQNQNELGVDCGGICTLSCEQKNAQPLEVSWIKNIKGDGDRTVILAEIKNPNFDYGASDFVYNLDVADISGNRTVSLTGRSFIYPSETKYLFEIIEGSQLITDNKIYFSQYDWKSGNDFKKPDVQVKSHNLKTGGQILTIEGIIKNIDLVKVSKVVITALVFDNSGTIRGVSKTELENLNPMDEKDFKIVFPKNLDLNSINQTAAKIYIDAIK